MTLSVGTTIWIFKFCYNEKTDTLIRFMAYEVESARNVAWYQWYFEIEEEAQEGGHSEVDGKTLMA